MVIVILLVLISPIIGAVKYTKSHMSLPMESRLTGEFTHTVFCEEICTTNCKFCPAASKILYNIYGSNDYPFYYITFVKNKNCKANSRANDDYNVSAVPNTFFDGGYQVNLGVISGETMYRTAIEKCGQREVPNLIMSMDVKWLEDARLSINLSIFNNESQPYRGHLRTYIVEPVSRWTFSRNFISRWLLNDKKPIHFGFLDYAFDENISINDEDNLNFYTDWGGVRHGYRNILIENIMVVAVVFNATSELQHSDPPNYKRPFNAYYVDQATASLPVINNDAQKDISNSGYIETMVEKDGEPNESILNIYYRAMQHLALAHLA